MNLILFAPGEHEAPLPRRDPRAEHILGVLRRKAGDSFDVGLVNGPRGKAVLTAVSEEYLTLAFTWGEAPPPLPALTLLVGLPRPQTARKILQDATAIGVSAIHFFAADRGEPSYAQSSLWSEGEWRRHLIAGAEQAFCTRLPVITWKQTLEEYIAANPGGARIALDNYESTLPLASAVNAEPLTLAFGAERGWSERERVLLREKGFVLADLGKRVLRSETAITFALGICHGIRN